MSDNLPALREALAPILDPEQIVGLKQNGDKVLLTVAVNVATPEKPAFADRIKAAARGVEGVKDVFVSFAEPAQQAPTQGATAPNPLEKVDRIVAVGAGKGGVGKSTVSVNLAVSLAQQGKKVGLLDADIYGPSAAVMTGCADHQAQGDEHQRVIPAQRHGVRVISIAFLLPEDQSAVVWRGPMVGKMIQQLLTSVAWGELDYLIVDLPPGTGDAVLSLTQTVPLSGAIVVTTPQDVALLDVLKAMEMFESVKVPVVGVVENMAGFTCPKCGTTTDIFLKGAGRKAADRFNVPLLGSLPLDPTVPPGGDGGEPIAVSDPDSATAKAFAALATEAMSRLDAMQGPPQGFKLNWEK
ncbi:MAG: Mrp/NBP35 family ATP-binding protein [Planctomycetota bacterium]|jgi:ATP-binding protein involved in chromosome partitioning